MRLDLQDRLLLIAALSTRGTFAGLIVALWAAGCGGAAEPATSSSTPSSVVATPPAPAPADPGVACAGPHLRGASGVVACGNQEGGWSMLSCYSCSLEAGEC